MYVIMDPINVEFQQNSDEYIRINPMAQVPALVLEDGKTCLTQSVK